MYHRTLLVKYVSQSCLKPQSFDFARIFLSWSFSKFMFPDRKSLMDITVGPSFNMGHLRESEVKDLWPCLVHGRLKFPNSNGSADSIGFDNGK